MQVKHHERYAKNKLNDVGVAPNVFCTAKKEHFQKSEYSISLIQFMMNHFCCVSHHTDWWPAPKLIIIDKLIHFHEQFLITFYHLYVLIHSVAQFTRLFFFWSGLVWLHQRILFVCTNACTEFFLEPAIRNDVYMIHCAVHKSERWSNSGGTLVITDWHW